MNPIQFADRHLHPYKIKDYEIKPEICPYCSGGSSGKDKYTFALHTEKKTFNCKRGSCNISGTFYKLLLDFGEIQNKQYKKPQVKINPASDGVVQYFKKRGISEDTVKKNKIGKKGNAIAYKFYENGELVMIKYRTKDKKIWREKDTRPIFYGMDDCDIEKPLIITEGENDKLTLDECGIDNAVSLPSGTHDLRCIEECWYWIDRFKRIIIWTDNDEPGRKARQNIINRLDPSRCQVVETAHKDANDLLLAEGKEAVREAVYSAKDIVIDGLLRVSEIEPYNPKEVKNIKSSITGLNNIMGGHTIGEFSIWTGDSASGKSTIISQEALEAIENREKVCVYSGELTASKFRYWIDLQAAGIEYIKESLRPDINYVSYYVSSDIRKRIQKWYHDYLFLYDINKLATSENILKVFEYTYRKYGCSYFVLDNLMSTQDTAENKYVAEDNVVTRIKDFVNRYPVHVHLIAHPKKNAGLDKDAIAGFKRITNKADNIYKVEKKNEGGFSGGLLTVLKDRFHGSGENNSFELEFCPKSKRYKMPSQEYKVYGWQETHKATDFIF